MNSLGSVTCARCTRIAEPVIKSMIKMGRYQPITPHQFDQILKENPNYNVTLGNEHGVTAMLLAAEFRNAQLISYIFQLAGPQGKELLNLANALGETPLIVASRKNSISVIKNLIGLGANVNICNIKQFFFPNIYQTPLWEALEYRNYESIQFLIANGAILHPESKFKNHAQAIYIINKVKNNFFDRPHKFFNLIKLQALEMQSENSLQNNNCYIALLPFEIIDYIAKINFELLREGNFDRFFL